MGGAKGAGAGQVGAQGARRVLSIQAAQAAGSALPHSYADQTSRCNGIENKALPHFNGTSGQPTTP